MIYDKREFVMLAHDYDAQKHRIDGWYVSEKMDGIRALWDGGVSRGLSCVEVPWANVEKHDRFVHETYATGLWTRYGQPVVAPISFLDRLPVGILLDGELWGGVDTFQDIGFIRSRTIDLASWDKITYNVFDSPTYGEVFAHGEINNPNFRKIIGPTTTQWLEQKGCDTRSLGSFFMHRLESLHKLSWGGVLRLVEQIKLPFNGAEKVMQERMEAVVSNHGEGIMLRAGASVWTPKRSYSLLKIKKFLDAEAKVIGFITGKKTKKGSKHLGRLGALVVEWNGIIFELGTGFSDAQRLFSSPEATTWATYNPGTLLPDRFDSKTFPRGTIVTFQYRTLTNDGTPREASFWRVKHD